MNTQNNLKNILITKANGDKEAFDQAKLHMSLLRSGAPEKVVNEILTSIEAEISDGMTTHQIYKNAFDLLHKNEHKSVAIKYSIKRAIMELGPTGFAFEDFVAEIFRQKGFQAETGKIVRGFCVEHEIDVVAWNEQKLIMVEAKFHNE